MNLLDKIFSSDDAFKSFIKVSSLVQSESEAAEIEADFKEGIVTGSFKIPEFKGFREPLLPELTLADILQKEADESGFTLFIENGFEPELIAAILNNVKLPRRDDALKLQKVLGLSNEDFASILQNSFDLFFSNNKQFPVLGEEDWLDKNNRDLIGLIHDISETRNRQAEEGFYNFVYSRTRNKIRRKGWYFKHVSNDDVGQIVVNKVFKSFESKRIPGLIPGHDNVIGWLDKVILRTCDDIFKESRAQIRQNTGYFTEDILDFLSSIGEYDAENLFHEKSIIHAFREAVQQLCTQERGVVDLLLRAKKRNDMPELLGITEREYDKIFASAKKNLFRILETKRDLFFE